MKSYTDLEQSKKLAEILPLESADMVHEYLPQVGDWADIPSVLPIVPYVFINDIPCWSLAALLDIIPKRIKDYNILRIDIDEKDFAIWYDEIGYRVNSELPNITMEEPVDACVEMIIKLHEQKLL